MYLREFSLGNFKAFGPTQTLPIRPLTLIFGPNSGGKSSLIHGLLLAAHAEKTKGKDLDVRQMEIQGEVLDLGGFSQYVFLQDCSRSVEFTFGLASEEQDSDTTPERVTVRIGQKQAEASRTRELVPEGAPHIEAWEFELGGKPTLTFGRSTEPGTLQIRSANQGVILAMAQVLAKESDSFRRVGKRAIGAALEQFAVNYRYESAEFLPRTTAKGHPYYPEKDPVFSDPHLDHSDIESILMEEGMEEHYNPPEIPLGPEVDAKAYALVSWMFKEFAKIMDSVCETVRLALGGLQYLGPLRSYPPRRILGSTTYGMHSRAGGLDSWEAVRGNEGVREQVNNWLGSGFLTTPYRFEVRPLYDFEDMKRRHDKPMNAKSIERQLARLASGVEPRDIELILVDQRTGARVSHRDIGVGISQVLPVLVTALTATGQMVAIEQPEIHLHPALQAELADVFIKAAVERKNSFLIETHSEHLILRILRRIRETAEGELPDGLTPIKPEDVSVVYIEPTPKGAVIHELPVTEDGDFTKKWPQGFFDERAAELF